MIAHEFKADPFGRDACDSKEDDADEGRVSHCGRPEAEHMDNERGLRIQLSTAVRERDDFKALNERSLERLHEAQESLAAARRALTTIEEILTECGYTDYAARVEAIKTLEALAAPAAAADRDPVIEEVPPHLCGGNNCEECGGPGAHHTDTCSCKEKSNV